MCIEDTSEIAQKSSASCVRVPGPDEQRWTRLRYGMSKCFKGGFVYVFRKGAGDLDRNLCCLFLRLVGVDKC